MAANATKIHIDGEADLKFQLGSQTFELCVWVSEQVEELDWVTIGSQVGSRLAQQCGLLVALPST